MNWKVWLCAGLGFGAQLGVGFDRPSPRLPRINQGTESDGIQSLGAEPAMTTVDEEVCVLAPAPEIPVLRWSPPYAATRRYFPGHEGGVCLGLIKSLARAYGAKGVAGLNVAIRRYQGIVAKDRKTPALSSVERRFRDYIVRHQDSPAIPESLHLHIGHKADVLSGEGDAFFILSGHSERLKGGHAIGIFRDATGGYQVLDANLAKLRSETFSLEQVLGIIARDYDGLETIFSSDLDLESVDPTAIMVRHAGSIFVTTIFHNRTSECVMTAFAPFNVFNHNDEGGVSGLGIAARFAYDGILRFLLQEPAVDLEQRSPAGMTALMKAALYGSFESVRLLVEAGASVNVKQNDGTSILQCAVEKGWQDIVRYLLSQDGVEVDSLLLYVAAQEGHEDIVRLLLDDDRIDVNERAAHNGAAPIHVAVHQSQAEVLDLLLAHPRVNRNRVSKLPSGKRQTILDMAIEINEARLTLYLRSKGVKTYAELKAAAKARKNKKP